MAETVQFSILLRDLASGGLLNFARNGERAFNRVDDAMDKVKGNASGLGSVFSFNQAVEGFQNLFGAASALVAPIFEVGAEFEKFDATLTTAFGSAKASAEAMDMLRDFAAKTPYQLDQITDSYIKYVNRGILPAQEELVALGDFAAANTKDMGQTTEAILDASNPERWKEFGVEVSKANGMVSLSWRGQTKTVKDNAAAVKGAIVEFGKMEGVSGMMENVSKTAGGQWSNILDTVDAVKLSIFDLFRDGFGGGLSFISQGLQGVLGFFKFLKTNANTLSKIYEPAFKGMQPLFDAFTRLGDAIGLTGDKGKFLEGVFNGIGNVISFIAPVFETVYSLIGAVIDNVTKVGIALFGFIQKNEWLQKSLMGLWQGAVNVFKGIADAAKSLLGGVGDLIAGILGGNLEQIKKGLSDLGDAFKSGNVFTLGAEAAKGFQEGYASGFNGKDFFAGQDPAKEAERTGKSLAEIRARQKARAGAGASATSNIKAGLAEVQGDARNRSVNLTIHKLIENMSFNTTNIQDSMTNLKETITRTVIDALRDVEIAAG